MTIEVWQGQAKDIAKVGDKGGAECTLGQGKVNLHQDLERYVKEGNEIIVAGEVREDGLHAYALKNKSINKITQIDSANYILIIGCGLFIFLLFSILGIRYLTVGNTALFSLNGVISLAGAVVALWALVRALQINKASNQIVYGSS